MAAAGGVNVNYRVRLNSGEWNACMSRGYENTEIQILMNIFDYFRNRSTKRM